MQINVENSKLQLVRGDITELDTDAIVNAANGQLVLGAGVAGAIRRKGGLAIQAQCAKKAPGQAVITTAGKLRARFVIHAVGPRMGTGNEDEKLKNATLSALNVADENDLTSIAFPAISTGVFGFPIDNCARIMLSATIDYLKGPTGLKKVVFCLFDADSYRIFEETLNRSCRQ